MSIRLDAVKNVADAGAVGTGVATLTAALPPIAAVFTIVWTALRIIEMVTGKPIHEIIRSRGKV